MGSVAKAVGGAINSVANSTVGKVLAPTFTIPAQLIQKATGLSPAGQLAIGGAVGAGLGAVGAMGGTLGAAGASGAGGAATATAGVNGTTAAFGPGGAGVLAQSGGVPLLTKVLMGASVASTLAGYFGRKPGQDYSEWFNGLDEESRNSVKQLEDNLTGMQQNVDVRNQAVSKVIDDFPAVAQQTYQGMKAAGGSYDESMKSTLDHAANQLSAKFASTGGFSSGAFNQGLADEAYKVAQPRADLDYQAELYKAQVPMVQAQMRLSEAQAQRDFQQKMLGQGSQNVFNANQNMLQMMAGNSRASAGLNQTQSMADNKASQDLFGSLGQTMGNVAMFPMMQQLYGNTNRMAAAQPAPQPRMLLPGNNASAGAGA